MDNKEIRERNNQIGIMLGWKYYEPKVDIDNSDCGGIYDRAEVWAKIPIDLNKYEEDDQYYFKEEWYSKVFENGGYYVTELKYNSDWNQLMEAVEFIGKVPVKDSEYASDYNVVIDLFGCCIETTGYHQRTVIDVDNGNRMESTFIAVSDFARLYNKGEL
jgi:hypothetical protein